VSDSDKAVVAGMLKARELGVKMLASDCEAILQAAIASMQVEAVAKVVDKEIDEKYGHTTKINWLKPVPWSQYLFTFPPDAAAEIARLTKESEEAQQEKECAGALSDVRIKLVRDFKMTALLPYEPRELISNDVWIDWDNLTSSTPRPAPDCMVRIKLRNGNICTGVASEFRWAKSPLGTDEHGLDIVAYKVIYVNLTQSKGGEE